MIIVNIVTSNKRSKPMLVIYKLFKFYFGMLGFVAAFTETTF